MIRMIANFDSRFFEEKGGLTLFFWTDRQNPNDPVDVVSIHDQAQKTYGLDCNNLAIQTLPSLKRSSRTSF